MNKAIKYRIYPNSQQKEMFAKTFGCCRFIWNQMLNDRIEYYKLHKKTKVFTPAMYKKDYPWLCEVDSLALANVQQNLQSAYNKFFKKKGKFPKFKTKHKSKKSYTTNNQNGTIRIEDSFIKIPKVGKIKIKLHRDIPENWIIKSATVSEDSAGKYFISILFEFDKDIKLIDKTNPELKILGLDYKSDGLYYDSEGNVANMPKFYQNMQKKLTHAQRKLSKKKRSTTSCSNNYIRQLNKVNKIHRKISNQRLDYLHKLSTQIANEYDVVVVEDIDMKNISNKHFHNGKATMNNGYGLFRTLLKYKLEDRGKFYIKVDRWYPSSQLCSNCSNKHKLLLKDKVYNCPKCGIQIDRDYNAALNIKAEGSRMLFI